MAAQARTGARRRRGAFGAALAASAALLTAAPAPAQDSAPPRPFAGIEPGEAFLFRFADGFEIALRLEEKTPEGSRWAVLDGQNPDAPRFGGYLYDADGRQTAYLNAEGEVEESYDPHNCERVQGACEYVLKNAEGEFKEIRRSALLNPEDYGRQDTALDLEWIYEILRESEGGHLSGRQDGTIRYDAEGLVRFEEWFESATGAEDFYARVE